MQGDLRIRFSAFAQFLRTPTLGRSVVLLFAFAIALLLAANIATLLMIQRTAAYNDAAENSQQLRAATNAVLITLLDAETGQRGYLLSSRPEFLQPYADSLQSAPERLAALRALVEGDPELMGEVTQLESDVGEKLTELQRTIDLVRSGQSAEALAAVRAGDGRVMMDRIRADIARIEQTETQRIARLTRESERAALITFWISSFAGLMVLILAGISLVLISRYVGDLHSAREAVDTLNAGLEDQVSERTAQLSRANEEIQRFAYIVSHDLRAPLVNVMGYTAELEQAGKAVDGFLAEAGKTQEIPPDVAIAVREDIPEATGFIRASTEKMDRLINAILKLSREGRRGLSPEPLDMTALAQRIADSINHQVAARGAAITVEPLPTIESDRFSIEQILGNLIDNAVKYLDADRAGQITVSGREEGDGVVFRVIDNGRGVAARDHERIFELFRRSGRQDRPGEGLGLAFVRNSVRRLGGEITVESELGKGSTFILKFPKRLVVNDGGDAA